MIKLTREMIALLACHPRPWVIRPSYPMNIVDANGVVVMSHYGEPVFQGIWAFLPDFLKRSPAPDDFLGQFVHHRPNHVPSPLGKGGVGRAIEVEGRFLKVEFHCSCMSGNEHSLVAFVEYGELAIITQETFEGAMQTHEKLITPFCRTALRFGQQRQLYADGHVPDGMKVTWPSAGKHDFSFVKE